MATEIKKSIQSYELMVIFTPVLAEEEYKAAQQKFTDIITSNGGEIVHSEAMGLRSLAYPIAKKTTGLYWLMEYKAPTDVNAKLEIQMNRDESIMRRMVTYLDKYAIAYNDRRRNGVKLTHSPKNASADAGVEENA
jgi:small subunit ribosomal protein S6